MAYEINAHGWKKGLGLEGAGAGVQFSYVIIIINFFFAGGGGGG